MIQPSIEVDVDKKYIVEVLDITEAPAQFDNAREGQMSLTWKFNLYNQQTGEMVVDANNGGDNYELWNFTPDTTYSNVKTGKKAKAREWTEALVGRELTDNEMNDLIDLGFADSLRGRRGLADLEWYLTKAGIERLKIIRLRPLKKNAPAVAEPSEPAVTPTTNGKRQKTPEEIAEKRRALGLDDAA